jgi:ABC-type transport system involved in multi-copper enzyme maturation permease subunit
MFAAYMHSLRETINKRMALVLIGMALLFAVLFYFIISVTPLEPRDMSMVFLGKRTLGPASMAVPAAMSAEISITGGLWLFLAIFASVPLLISALEKGWVELTLTKGVARWKVLMGAYFSGLTLYVATLLVAMVPTALWLWMKTGIGCKTLLVAILIEALGFASLMSLAVLASLTRTGASLPIMLAIFVDILSPVLSGREQGLFQIVTSNWGRATLNWTYKILPKPFDLVTAANNYIQYDSLKNWFPFWTTGLFTVVVLGISMWMLSRKNL